ncbi:uncharacterized protein N7473_006271 [Penicillium subrubescens]|uniref:uncharacterized protein n=1 Tax=Penicillium subrubescens TaxID=1316194 RepID=UPI002545021D|nr:uncharacterized protein N7473_006271 [Penicillium subrubescens]KAJ5896872.1 hypothetical protein N7473_006271 [Penicillium subrubescens]
MAGVCIRSVNIFRDLRHNQIRRVFQSLKENRLVAGGFKNEREHNRQPGTCKRCSRTGAGRGIN